MDSKDGMQGESQIRSSEVVRPTDTDLLNWLEQEPHENLQAVEYRLTHGHSKTIREALEYYQRRGL